MYRIQVKHRNQMIKIILQNWIFLKVGLNKPINFLWCCTAKIAYFVTTHEQLFHVKETV